MPRFRWEKSWKTSSGLRIAPRPFRHRQPAVRVQCRPPPAQPVEAGLPFAARQAACERPGSRVRLSAPGACPGAAGRAGRAPARCSERRCAARTGVRPPREARARSSDADRRAPQPARAGLAGRQPRACAGLRAGAHPSLLRVRARPCTRSALTRAAARGAAARQQLRRARPSRDAPLLALCGAALLLHGAARPATAWQSVAGHVTTAAGVSGAGGLHTGLQPGALALGRWHWARASKMVRTRSR